MMPKNTLIAVLALTSAACMCVPGGGFNFDFGADQPSSPTSSPPLAETGGGSILDRFEGGTPCPDNEDFTCVTLEVPLNHAQPDAPERLEVVFAIYPAEGQRRGMFVQAFPGGPGGEGISSAGLDWFDPQILQHYDIVYFDQRGLGLSSPLECPQAQNIFYNSDWGDEIGGVGLDTPEEEQRLVQETQTFVADCIAEMGVTPEHLIHYGTEQVAEDLELFRQQVGDEQFFLYGVSYGTQVAQVYAAAYPQHLAGLILDGTIDLTLSRVDYAVEADAAFNDVLVASLEACTADPACAAEVGGDALATYDRIAAGLAEERQTIAFPLPDGTFAEREVTFYQLEAAAASSLYSINGRMLLMRALAAAEMRGDYVPLARLAYDAYSADPLTELYQPDPFFSDLMYTTVECADYVYYTGGSDEQVEQVLEAGRETLGLVPRLDGQVYQGLNCAYWPGTQEAARPAPSALPGVTTFVLNATLDPATPFANGQRVFERLEDGYHLYVEGGRHSIYGFGYPCPDDHITNFMIDGLRPEEREISCFWGPAVLGDYVPLLPQRTADFPDLAEMFRGIFNEIFYLPEYYYGDFIAPVSVGCNFGGGFTFTPNDVGEDYTFTDCAFVEGFIMTGSGTWDYDTGIITYDLAISGEAAGELVFTYDYNQDQAAVTGTYAGEQIDIRE